MTHSIKGDYLRGGKHSARATTLPRNNILIGDVRDRLAELPTSSVDTIITSPPYFGVRNYGHDQQLGAEPDVDGWVEGLRDTAREFARVLRPTGSLWLNLGDSYARRPTEGAPVKRSFPLAGRFVVLGMTGLAERLVPDELWEFF
ncbi:DNA methyltransferase, partial [Streptomyces sp. NPDC093249]